MYLPDATTLYVGGDQIAEDVKAPLLNLTPTIGGLDVTDSRIWTFKCLFSRELMDRTGCISQTGMNSLNYWSGCHFTGRMTVSCNGYNVLHDSKIWISDLIPERSGVTSRPRSWKV